MKQLLIILAILFSGTAFAQELADTIGTYGVVSAGGSEMTAEGSISISVGQVACQSANYSMYRLLEGVQQPYTIVRLNATTELQLSIYPNPTIDYIVISADNNLNGLTYQLYDATGSLLKSERWNGADVQIPMAGYAVGAYFLKVSDDSRYEQNYKIIKGK